MHAEGTGFVMGPFLVKIHGWKEDSAAALWVSPGGIPAVTQQQRSSRWNVPQGSAGFKIKPFSVGLRLGICFDF